eukprot:39986_1
MWHLYLFWVVFISFISLLSLLYLFRKQISLRIYGMKQSYGYMTFLWSANGGNASKIGQILSSVYNMDGTQPHSWVFEFSKIAKKLYTKQILMNLDENKSTNHNQHMMQRVYDQASLWFSIAKYPHVLTNTSKMECYKLHKLCYARAMEMNHHLLEFEEIKIATRRPNSGCITGYLHKSVVAAKTRDVAFVILIGSIDIWKSDFWFVVHQFLQHNISVFTMDLAGTGDNHYKLDQNAVHIYQDTIKWFHKHNRYGLNMANLGVFGIGFGGYFAIQLPQQAQAQSQIKFVITLSAPLIYTFNTNWILSQMDPVMVNACCFAMDIKQGNKYKLARALQAWKLKDYSDESLGHCKVLNIFGGNDTFINPLDGNVFSNQKMRFKQDGYCCTKNIKKWVPQVISFISLP